MVNPGRIQFAPLGIEDQSCSREETLHCCGSGWRSQVPWQRVLIVGVLGTYIFHLLANATRATPAGPLATSDGSIFCHQARHSTSCRSEKSTLSTRASTLLVLSTPAFSFSFREMLNHFFSPLKVLPPLVFPLFFALPPAAKTPQHLHCCPQSRMTLRQAG